jgi:hypothetical protein
MIPPRCRAQHLGPHGISRDDRAGCRRPCARGDRAGIATFSRKTLMMPERPPALRLLASGSQCGCVHGVVLLRRGCPPRSSPSHRPPSEDSSSEEAEGPRMPTTSVPVPCQSPAAPGPCQKSTNIRWGRFWRKTASNVHVSAVEAPEPDAAESLRDCAFPPGNRSRETVGRPLHEQAGPVLP